MFSPRLAWALPLGLLLPAALALRRRAVWLPVALSAVLLLGPVMRLCVPWRRVLPPWGEGATYPPLRIVTLNADLGDLDAAALRRWVEQVRPDVVLLQACRNRDRRAAFGEAGSGGWHGRQDGDLVIQSRFPVTDSAPYRDPLFSVGGGALRFYDVQTPHGPLRLFNLHLATPRYGLLAVAHEGIAGADELGANTRRRGAQSRMARRWVDESLARGARVVVAGDFNTPTDSTVYRRDWPDFTNAFSAAGFGFGNTHFTRRTAVRIDHVLAGPGLRVRRAWVGLDVGSAHRPVVVEVQVRPSL